MLAGRVRDVIVEQFSGLGGTDAANETFHVLSEFGFGPDDEISASEATDVVWALVGDPMQAKDLPPLLNVLRESVLQAVAMLDWPEPEIEDDPDRRWSERNDD